MKNIINFPGSTKAVPERNPPVIYKSRNIEDIGIGAAVIKAVWVLTVLVWPLLKLVVSIDCFFQLVRMIYHWNTPGMHAGITFTIHFAVLTALTYFVSAYKPKDL